MRGGMCMCNKLHLFGSITRRSQVRWDATAGFHASELVKKECTSLEEALQVGGCP